MKIILSRKGFDSEYGGTPSPILPDGTMLSMPIPSDDKTQFSDLAYDNKTYSEILGEIHPKGCYSTCHLDPDIRPGIHKNRQSGWNAALGQCDRALSHLKNQGVTTGDLFLFFGLYRQCVVDEHGMLKYDKTASNIHAIYGYMQIGEMLNSTDIITRVPWHPHANMASKNNMVFLAADKLNICGKETNKLGYGCFHYRPELCLTKNGMSPTCWEVPSWFKDAKISYHSENSFKDGYFRSASKGQEFVIQDFDEAEKWAQILIQNGMDEG